MVMAVYGPWNWRHGARPDLDGVGDGTPNRHCGLSRRQAGELGEHGDGQVRFDAQVRQFATQRAKELLGQLQVRNNSILAHGFRPRSWMEERFLPVLRIAGSRAGVKEMPPQSPTEPPEIVRMIGGSDEGKVGRLADSAPTAHTEA